MRSISIKDILFVAMPAVAAVSLLLSATRTATIKTGDDFDLTILGRGYIETRDAVGENPIYVRNLRLAINEYSQLCAIVDGAPRCLEPRIHMPNDRIRFEIGRQGKVDVDTAESASRLQVGVLTLFCFDGENLDRDESVVWNPDRLGTPIQSAPGEHGAGYLLHGFRQQSVIGLDAVSMVGLSALCFSIGFACWRATSPPTPPMP